MGRGTAAVRVAGVAAFVLAVVSSVLSIVATNSDGDGSGLRVLRYAVGLCFLVVFALWVFGSGRSRRGG